MITWCTVCMWKKYKRMLNNEGDITMNYVWIIYKRCRSMWPRGLRRRSAGVRLLWLWVRIPPGTRMSARCECCVFPGRGLCDELITRLEQSYRLCCVVVCDLETSWMRRSLSAWGHSVTGEKKCKKCVNQIHEAWLSVYWNYIFDVYRVFLQLIFRLLGKLGFPSMHHVNKGKLHMRGRPLKMDWLS